MSDNAKGGAPANAAKDTRPKTEAAKKAAASRYGAWAAANADLIKLTSGNGK